MFLLESFDLGAALPLFFLENKSEEDRGILDPTGAAGTKFSRRDRSPVSGRLEGCDVPDAPGGLKRGLEDDISKACGDAPLRAKEPDAEEAADDMES
ncbi:MAG: hypothetical protein M1819_003123 [Sarea resinae]|nr:MAG: hypothetical protein M1819_003123 [Sarea resinae]